MFFKFFCSFFIASSISLQIKVYCDDSYKINCIPLLQPQYLCLSFDVNIPNLIPARAGLHQCQLMMMVMYWWWVMVDWLLVMVVGDGGG